MKKLLAFGCAAIMLAAAAGFAACGSDAQIRGNYKEPTDEELSSALDSIDAERLFGDPDAAERTIGFPTLNLAWSPELRPRYGVYVVRLRVPASGKVFRGIANYGVRPTVERDGVPAPLLETHLPDVPAGVSAPTYGDFIRVEWLRFVRPETRFDGIGALKAQLEKDKLAALDFSEETYPAGV